MAVPQVQSGQNITAGITREQFEAEYPDSDNFDNFDANNDGVITQDEISRYDTNHDGRINTEDLGSSEVAGSQLLTEGDKNILQMLVEADALLNYLMEKIRTSANGSSSSTINTYISDLTQEQIDQIMDELINEFLEKGLDSDAMCKDHFKQLLQAISDKFGLGWTEDQIDSLADDLIKNNWLGLNSRGKEEVVAFLKEKGLWPTPAQVTNRLTYQKLKEMYSSLDTNQDGNLSWEEAQSVLTREEFDRLDANNDGLVTYPEICNAQGATGFIDANQDGVYSAKERADALARFGELDANGDGKLSRDELQMSDENFAKFDTDGDGFIDRKELGEFQSDPSRSGWYNNYKEQIDSISDFSSSSVGLWTTNMINKIVTFLSTLTSLGKSTTDLASAVDRRANGGM